MQRSFDKNARFAQSRRDFEIYQLNLPHQVDCSQIRPKVDHDGNPLGILGAGVA